MPNDAGVTRGFAGLTVAAPGTPSLSLIVPCYNEAGAIADTVRRGGEILSRLNLPHGFEIVVVDDGSTDGSSELLQSLQAADVRVVRHPWNRGYGAALKTGIAHTSAEWIAITDADGTYPNGRIPDLLSRAELGADMVVGARTAENVRYSMLRAIPKWFLRGYAQWVTQQAIPDINSGLRIFRRDLAQRHFHILPDGFSFTTTITIAALMEHRKVVFVPIDYAPRVGRSKIKPIRDTWRFFSLVVRTGMYFAPLRMLSPLLTISWLGFLASLAFDVLVLRDLRELTALLLMIALNLLVLGLVADMMRRRTERV